MNVLGAGGGVVGELKRTISEIEVVRTCGCHIRGSCCCYCYGAGALITATIAGGGSTGAGAGVASAGRFEKDKRLERFRNLISKREQTLL